MRILFLESHPMWIHGLPNGFLDAGHQVKISGELTEDNIPNLINKFRPDLIFTMGWGPENTGDKPDWIREHVKKSGIPHVYWATEDPTHTQSFSLPYIQKVEPEFVFTICPSRIEFYRRQGIKSAHLDFGFHRKVHYRTMVEPRYCCDIAVVANAYPLLAEQYPNHYRLQSIEQLIYPTLKAGLRIDFWGRQWDEVTDRLGGIPQQCIHNYLEYTEANKIYSSAKIIIGLQNHLTQLNQRVYEILGSGGFLLTNDTLEIKRLFTPGKDLVVAASPQETVEVIQYYLKHPEEREKIRSQAQISAQEHSYSNRANYIVDVLKVEGII